MVSMDTKLSAGQLQLIILPPNLWRFCLNFDLQCEEKLAKVEIYQLCKNDGHKMIFTRVVLFQTDFLCKIEKTLILCHFFSSLYSFTSVNAVSVNVSSVNYLKFSQRLLLYDIHMMHQIHDHSTIFVLVALREKSAFFAIFVNFQVI